MELDNSYNIELNYVTENEFGQILFILGLSLYPNYVAYIRSRMDKSNSCRS